MRGTVGLIRSVTTASAALFLLGALTVPAQAVPGLQLDIVGGTYDSVTETIVTTGNTFRVLAIATPTGNLSQGEIETEEFFLSMALLPPAPQNPSFDAGSFLVNGSPVFATAAAMTFGTPPVDAASNQNLPSHGIYDSYFAELAFHFDPNQRTPTYNAQTNAGGALFVPGTTGGSYYYEFVIDKTALLDGYQIHFDLYDTAVKRGNIIVDHFAPFSHDAESRPPDDQQVPEPASWGMLLGLIGLGWARRRARAAA